MTITNSTAPRLDSPDIKPVTTTQRFTISANPIEDQLKTFFSTIFPAPEKFELWFHGGQSIQDPTLLSINYGDVIYKPTLEMLKAVYPNLSQETKEDLASTATIHGGRKMIEELITQLKPQPQRRKTGRTLAGVPTLN